MSCLPATGTRDGHFVSAYGRHLPLLIVPSFSTGVKLMVRAGRRRVRWWRRLAVLGASATANLPWGRPRVCWVGLVASLNLRLKGARWSPCGTGRAFGEDGEVQQYFGLEFKLVQEHLLTVVPVAVFRVAVSESSPQTK